MPYPGQRRLLSRRTLLRGAGSGLAAAVALPPLQAMLNRNGDAHADGSPLPVRFGVWYWGNGVRLDSWLPPDFGPGYSPSPALQPLADAGVLPMVSVVSNLAVAFGQEVVHDVGRAAMLSGSYSITEPTVGLGGNATLRSIDQIAADTLAVGTPFRSLEVGVSQVGFLLEPNLASVSWNDPVSPLPAEFSPFALFDRMFGDALSDASLIHARRSVLDVVKEDAAALSAKLGASDRARLEAHLDGLRGIELQLQGISAECELPPVPTDPDNDGLNNEPLREVSRAMADLLTVALTCDLTRVFNFRFSASASDTYFNTILPGEAHHVMTHDPAFQDTVAEVVVFVMSELAYFLERLAAQPEGDGTLLDNMVIYGLSEVSEGLTHSTVDMPVLVAGGGAGALVPGQHVRTPMPRNSSVLPLTLLRAVGVNEASFGAEEGKVTDVVSELLA